MTAKRWIQIIGGGLMLEGVLGGRTGHMWHPTIILSGAIIFLCSFLIRKPKQDDDDSGKNAMP